MASRALDIVKGFDHANHYLIIHIFQGSVHHDWKVMRHYPVIKYIYIYLLLEK